MPCLAEGSWPELEHVNLSKSGLDAAAVGGADQGHGKGPPGEGRGARTGMAELVSKPAPDAAAKSLLSFASWPAVEMLEMRCTQLTAAMVSRLIQRCVIWRNLSNLKRRWAGLSAAALSQLARGILTKLTGPHREQAWGQCNDRSGVC